MRYYEVGFRRLRISILCFAFWTFTILNFLPLEPSISQQIGDHGVVNIIKDKQITYSGFNMGYQSPNMV